MPMFTNLVNRYIDNKCKEYFGNGGGKVQGQPSAGNEERKTRLAALLRIDPGIRPVSKPELLEQVNCGDYIRERWVLQTEAELAIAVYVLLPLRADSPRPAILALHGHGYGSRSLVGLTREGREDPGAAGIYKNFGISLVRRGFIVAAPELLGFGDRMLEQDMEAGWSQYSSSCYKLSSYLLFLGKTLAGMRVYETLCVIDFILERPEVRRDGSGIGCMGLSTGAQISYLTAALDDRIGALVLSGYANTYEDSGFFNRQHCLCDYIPGFAELGDMPEVIGLTAPRPLFIEGGLEDPLFPAQGTLKAIRELESIYRTYDAEDRLFYHLFEGGHEISGIKSIEWLAQQLRVDGG